MTSPRRPTDGKSTMERQLADEAARLLEGRRFSSSSGVAAQSEHVAIHVSPIPDTSEGTFTAAVMCRAFGHLRVDWNSVAVSIFDEHGTLVSRQLLDARGRTVISGLPHGRFQIGGVVESAADVSAGEHTYLPQVLYVAESFYIPDSYAAKSEAGDARPTVRGAFEGGHVRYEVAEEGHYVWVMLESSDPQHKGGNVEIEFVESGPDERVIHSVSVPIGPSGEGRLRVPRGALAGHHLIPRLRK
jgi:hypothetical protein